MTDGTSTRGRNVVPTASGLPKLQGRYAVVHGMPNILRLMRSVPNDCVRCEREVHKQDGKVL